MGTLGWPQIIIILAVIVLLFGSRKLPDLARGLGSSLRIFRAETKALSDDDKGSSDANASTEQPRAVDPPATSSTEQVGSPVSEGAPDQTKRDS